jgi:hypothetical protein
MYFVGGIVAPEFYGSDTDRPGAPVHLPGWLEGSKDPEEYEDRIFHHEAESIAQLVERVAQVFRPEGKPGTLGVTCSPFIPKPHTPWEAWPMASEKGLKRLDKILQRRLARIPRVRYRPFSAWEALFQGILSQGGQNLEEMLIEAARHPEKLKGLVRDTIRVGLVRIHERRWTDAPPPWGFVRL